MRTLPTLLFALLAACSTAEARKIADVPVLSTQESPYSIELVDPAGRSLSTYEHRGRFYIEGQAGQRYSIRVENPTAQRVEAVISVDGLDVIDGQTANFKTKRGYIVEPHGSLEIDGFRVSTSHVAAFRFSSVKDSYAGRKGKARHVGVIGVGFFSEKAPPQMVQPYPNPPLRPYPRRRLEHSQEPSPPRAKRSYDGGGSAGSADAESARAAPANSAGVGRRQPLRRRPPRARAKSEIPTDQRPGLGTQFGERRYSSVRYTPFERAHATQPTAIAEFRYNDRQGLAALGIPVPPYVGPRELELRESASSFPESRFAEPPR